MDLIEQPDRADTGDLLCELCESGDARLFLSIVAAVDAGVDTARTKEREMILRSGMHRTSPSMETPIKSAYFQITKPVAADKSSERNRPIRK